jgi:hypothetical protein
MAETTVPSTGEPENLVLLRLREIRDILGRHSGNFNEVITRLPRLEREMAGARRDIANLHDDRVGQSHRLDGFATRRQP